MVVDGPSITSLNTVTCACVPEVAAYVRRSACVFEIRVLKEHGAQVKDDCGGSAYDVISLEEEIWGKG